MHKIDIGAKIGNDHVNAYGKMDTYRIFSIGIFLLHSRFDSPIMFT